jgi:hypothetical protein
MQIALNATGITTFAQDGSRQPQQYCSKCPGAALPEQHLLQRLQLEATSQRVQLATWPIAPRSTTARMAAAPAQSSPAGTTRH